LLGLGFIDKNIGAIDHIDPTPPATPAQGHWARWSNPRSLWPNRNGYG